MTDEESSVQSAARAPIPQLTEEPEPPPSRLQQFERKSAWPMLVLALLSAALLISELVIEDIPASTLRTLAQLDIAITVIFATEYLYRLIWLAKGSRWNFVRSHVLDLIVIIPIFQPLRILRSVRILRTIRVARATALLGKSVHESRDLAPTFNDIPRVFAVSAVIVVAAAALVWGIERQTPEAGIHTFPDALWWAVTTATTMGSGHEPMTPEGRLIAVGLMVLGISIVATLAGILASSFVKDKSKDDLVATRAEIADLRKELREMRDLMLRRDAPPDQRGRVPE